MAGPSLLGKNPELPYDLQTEQSQLAIAQLIAMELLKQGLTPATSTAQHGFPNVGDITSGAAMQDAAERQLKRIGTQQGDIAARYNNLLAEAMGRYTKTRMGELGTPEIPAAPDAAGVSTGPPVPGTPGIKPDLAGAIKMAAGSNIPAMQAIAAADIKELPGGKDMLQYMKDYAVPGRNEFLATGDPSNLRGMPQYHQAGNVDTTVQEGFPIAKGATQEYGDMGLDKDTGLPIIKGKIGNKTEAVTQNFPTNIGGPVAEKRVQESMTDARLATEANASIDAILRDLDKIPPKALGVQANVELFLNRWSQALGGKPLDWTGPLENVKGQLDQLMAGKLRQFAPASDPDVQVARSMMGGNFTAAGLKEMLTFLKSRNDVALQRHNSALEGYLQNLTPNQREGMRKMLEVLPAAPNVPSTDAEANPDWKGEANHPYAKMTKAQLKAEYERQFAIDKAKSGGR